MAPARPARSRFAPFVLIAGLAGCVDVDGLHFDRAFDAAGPDAAAPPGDAASPPVDARRVVSDFGDARDAMVAGDARIAGDAASPPADCPAAQDCTARACGPDPVCGASCGVCRLGTTCAEGLCACLPVCDGRTCGGDGCGGSCGACPDGQFCQGGACQPIPGGCPGLADCGGLQCGPDPVCGTPCGDCPGGTACRDGTCECVPACAGRACGDDGCGGACGACPAGRACTDGQCVEPPPQCPDIADCAGLACGPDPVCGVPCGRCDGGLLCRGGQCVCAPDCGARVCGDDGCGGQCGQCPPGTACTAGQCAAPPPQCPDIADCGGLACGPDPVCGVECGRCPAGQVCRSGNCLCAPDCGGRQCGADGCGGSCGACARGQLCGADGQCRCPPTWRVRTPFDKAGHMVTDGASRVYLSGHADDAPLLMSLDACDGATIASRALADPQLLFGAAAMGMTRVGNDLLVGGLQGSRPEDNPQGFYARVSAQDLSLRWLTPLLGNGPLSNVWGLGVDGQGRVLMVGETPEPGMWLLQGSPDIPDACGWTYATPGRGRAATAIGGSVWMTGALGADVAILAVGPDCGPVVPPGCVCPPLYERRVSPFGGNFAEGRALAEGPDGVYVAGFGNSLDAPGDFAGALYRARTDVDPQLVATWNATPAGDAFMGVAIVGGRAYVSAVSGLPGDFSSFDVGETGHLLIYELATGMLLRDTVLGQGLPRAVGAVGDGVVVILAHDLDAEIVRCTLEGDCG